MLEFWNPKTRQKFLQDQLHLLEYTRQKTALPAKDRRTKLALQIVAILPQILEQRGTFMYLIQRFSSSTPLALAKLILSKMAALSKLADVLQKSVAFSCMAASVYLLVFTGRNYLALREKRLANAASIATQKEIEVSSESAGVPGQETMRKVLSSKSM